MFFTASIAAKKNMHIHIDVIFTLASPAVGRMLDIFGSLMSAAFAAYLTYSGGCWCTTAGSSARPP